MSHSPRLRLALTALLVAGLVLATAVPTVGATAVADAPASERAADELTDVSDDGDDPTAGATGPGPRILELYPNPVTHEDRGEYLIVRLPTPGNWSLTDGYFTAAIPPTVSGVVAISMHPADTRSHLAGRDVPVVRPESYFPLATTDERVVLRRDDVVVDVVAYDRAREGYRWRAAWDEWRPDGYEPRDSKRTAGATVTPFVLPDSPHVPVEVLTTASDRLYLAGYTVESERVADRLVKAAARGVDVRVLMEGTPVGGFPARGARVADRLVAAGIPVRVFDGTPRRFRFHHAKYAVVDDSAIVLTENWKRSGTGGNSSRGWGVVVDDRRVAADLAAVFTNDADGADTRRWASFRTTASVHGPAHPAPRDQGGILAADQPYPARFSPPPATTADVELLTAPDNAGDRIVARVDAADERVLAVIPRTGGPDGRIVRALRRAASRGVDVHLLLSNAWYDRDRNRALLEALSDEPIVVAIAEPRSRYEKVHAKGLVIDDTAIVGSLNWNEGATTRNREVLLAVENAAVADFYARTYAADWRGGGVHLPVGMLAGLSVTLGVAVVVTRREVAFA